MPIEINAERVSHVEASKILGVSPRTLYTYVRAQRVPASFYAGKWRYRTDDLYRFMARSEVQRQRTPKVA